MQTNAHIGRTPGALEEDGVQLPVVSPCEGFKVLGEGISAEVEAWHIFGEALAIIRVERYKIHDVGLRVLDFDGQGQAKNTVWSGPCSDFLQAHGVIIRRIS